MERMKHSISKRVELRTRLLTAVMQIDGVVMLVCEDAGAIEGYPDLLVKARL